MSPTGVATFLASDHLGSVRTASLSNGTVSLARDYDPWGRLLAGDSVAGAAFTGREWEPGAGLYYYRARYYDPKGGRFVSEDLIGLRGGSNFYEYVRGRPTVLTDPLGLVSDADVQKVCREQSTNSDLPPHVRDCIKRKCDAKAWKVRCATADECRAASGHGENYAFTTWKDDINLCSPTTQGAPCQIPNSILHEMLHNCLGNSQGRPDAQHGFILPTVARIYPCGS
jgi:RHS repeat-associated protein